MKDYFYSVELAIFAVFFVFIGYLIGEANNKPYTAVDVELARRAGMTEGAKAVALKCDTKAYLQEGLK